VEHPRSPSAPPPHFHSIYDRFLVCVRVDGCFGVCESVSARVRTIWIISYYSLSPPVFSARECVSSRDGRARLSICEFSDNADAYASRAWRWRAVLLVREKLYDKCNDINDIVVVAFALYCRRSGVFSSTTVVLMYRKCRLFTKSQCTKPPSTPIIVRVRIRGLSCVAIRPQYCLNAVGAIILCCCIVSRSTYDEFYWLHTSMPTILVSCVHFILSAVIQIIIDVGKYFFIQSLKFGIILSSIINTSWSSTKLISIRKQNS